ncbi:Uncharacterised protein [Bifidobacterium dentium]|nr:hypothetical protein SAMN05192536_0684 [Bifidobacterium dentium JCM 1195 = DSM 20436]VEG23250.1 Uncharacterised protein [Bifidobacterium dentium]
MTDVRKKAATGATVTASEKRTIPNPSTSLPEVMPRWIQETPMLAGLAMTPLAAGLAEWHPLAALIVALAGLTGVLLTRNTCGCSTSSGRSARANAPGPRVVTSGTGWRGPSTARPSSRSTGER